MTGRLSLVLSVAAGFAIGLVCSQGSVSRLAQSQESKPTQSGEMGKLESSAKEFEDAFNKGDAAAIAAQFLENAEVIDEDGNVVVGRENIQSRFAELFKAHPKAKVVVELTSLRQLGPDVAVEDGYSTTNLGQDEPASRSPYTLIHLKRNGKWGIASIRDFPEESNDTAHDQLQQLGWLVGDWVDHSGDTKVETSCQWDHGESYLIQHYVVKTREGHAMKGSQRIGWDPNRKTIRSWAFDETGGYVEGTWTAVEGGWIIKASGYAADGRLVSATRTVSLLGTDLYQLDSTQRLVGDELLPDASVRVARRPPEPAVK